MQQQKYILGNLKNKLVTKLSLIMVVASSLFQNCDEFNPTMSFVMAYDPATDLYSVPDSVHKCEQYGDKVNIKIYMVPDTATRNFSCEKFFSVAKNIQSCFTSKNKNTWISLSGEIIIHESGCKERTCEVPIPFQPGMYKDDSVWFSYHDVIIRIYGR